MREALSSVPPAARGSSRPSGLPGTASRTATSFPTPATPGTSSARRPPSRCPTGQTPGSGSTGGTTRTSSPTTTPPPRPPSEYMMQALFRTPGGYALIAESDLAGSYSAARLTHSTRRPTRAVRHPEPRGYARVVRRPPGGAPLPGAASGGVGRDPTAGGRAGQQRGGGAARRCALVHRRYVRGRGPHRRRTAADRPGQSAGRDGHGRSGRLGPDGERGQWRRDAGDRRGGGRRFAATACPWHPGRTTCDRQQEKHRATDWLHFPP